jgi:hypothetical protein
MSRGGKARVDDPKAAAARSEAAQIAALKQRRAVGVPPIRHIERQTGSVADLQSDPPAPAGVAHPLHLLERDETIELDATTRREQVHLTSLHGTSAGRGVLSEDVVSDPSLPSTRLRRIPHVLIRTSFRLPVVVFEELRKMLIEERGRGRRLRLQSVINDAVLSLPVDTDSLVDTIDTYGTELNIGVMAGERDYLVETSVSLSLTEEVNERLGQLVEALRERDLVVGRKTLLGVAVVRVLRNGLQV